MRILNEEFLTVLYIFIILHPSIPPLKLKNKNNYNKQFIDYF